MFTMSLFCGFVCAIAAFAGGFIDAISGGGGLLTIPALLLTGVPPHLALGTNKVSACCGTTVALFNFAKHGLVNWRMAGYGIIFSIIGSWLGAWLALILESALLGKVLVALLPLAMIATLLPQKQHDDILPPRDGFRFWVLLPIVCVAIGLYDGFFGPGTGIFLILALHWVLKMGLIQASATAKAFNLASNVSAAVSFIWHDAACDHNGRLLCGRKLDWQRGGHQNRLPVGQETLACIPCASAWHIIVAILYRPGKLRRKGIFAAGKHDHWPVISGQTGCGGPERLCSKILPLSPAPARP